MNNRAYYIWPMTMLLSVFGYGAIAQDAPQDISEGEQELAELIEGRVAGDPVRCIKDADIRSFQIIDHTALIIRHGRTLYVNKTRAPEQLDKFDIPVFRRISPSLCRNDRIDMRDRYGRLQGPFVILEEFIPYTSHKDELSS